MIQFASERESTLIILWLPNDGTLQSDLFDIPSTFVTYAGDVTYAGCHSFTFVFLSLYTTS